MDRNSLLAQQNAEYASAQLLDQMRDQNRVIEKVIELQDDWERSQNLEKLNNMTPEQRRQLMVERVIIDEESSTDELEPLVVKGQRIEAVYIPYESIEKAASGYRPNQPLCIYIPLLMGPRAGNAKKGVPYWIYGAENLERLLRYLQQHKLLSWEKQSFELLKRYAEEKSQRLGVSSDELLSQLIDNGMKQLEIVDLLSNGVEEEEIIRILLSDS